MLDINQYQENVVSYNDYPKELGPYYSVMGIMAVTGTLAEKVQALVHTQDGKIDKRYAMKMAISLGDILRYISCMAADLNMGMDEIMSINLKKLEMERQKKMEEQKTIISENDVKNK